MRGLIRLGSIAMLLAAAGCGIMAGSLQRSKQPRTDPLVLAHHDISPGDIPPPSKGVEANNPPRVVPKPDNARLVLPPGFACSVYAEGGFNVPRWLALAPNGDVFLADSGAGSIIVLRDSNKDGVVDARYTFATGLREPFGMAFVGNALFVGNTNAVVRFDYAGGQTAASGPPTKIVDIPADGYNNHWTRNVVPTPDGRKLVVSVGSSGNVNVEKDPRRAAILEMNLDGTGSRLFATGTRNPVGMAFNPVTKALWAVVQERDMLGDDVPPDYLTAVKDGGFYGWPYSYTGRNPDPRREGERPDLVETAIVPDVLIQAHSAPLGLVFYGGDMFPAEYKGDAFVALHGSWNRSVRTGYKIIRVKFKDGRPVGGYDDFLSGWMLDEDSRDVWGRPVGLLVLPDGSLLVVDDGAKKIWRVTYNRSDRK